MSLTDYAKNHHHTDSMDKTQALADGKYLVMIENIGRASVKFKGDFTFVQVRVQTNEDISYPSDEWLFKDKKGQVEKGFPKSTAAGTSAKISFSEKSDTQVEKLFKMLAELEPDFKGKADEQGFEAKGKLSPETIANRERIINAMDGEDQPYRGRLINVTVTRGKAKETGNIYRNYKFQAEDITAEDLKANRAELDA